MIGFTFRGRHSSEFNVGCRSIDRSAIPARRKYELVIPHRSGTREISSDIYDKRKISVEVAAVFEESFEEFRLKIRELAYWLSGTGELFFDDEPDKKYTASLYDAIPLQQILLQPKAVVEITFDCQPFAFSDVISLPIKKGKNEITYKGTAKTPTKIILRNTSNYSAVNISISITKRRKK